MTTTLVTSPFVALAPGDDGYLVYQLQTDTLHRLNPAASLLVELCDGRDLDTVLRQVASLVDSGSVEACRAWMDFAVEARLLVPPGTPDAPAPSLDDFAEAARDLRREGQVLAAFVCQFHVVSSRQDSADDWVALGELAHIVGRRDDAREAYERYLALEPDDAEVQQILVSLRGDAPTPRAPDRCIQQLYSRFAAFYETNMRGDLDYQAPERIAEALADALGTQTGLDVLELGCGTGLAAPTLRPYASRLTGIDLSPEMVEKAREGGQYDALEVAEITTWLARDQTTFDLVVACDTLIYFGDLGQVTVPVASRLRPGGRLVFTVERDPGASFRLTDSGRYAHSASHIREAAAAAGLHVERLTEGLLRYEYGKEVIGLVTVLRRD